MERDYYKKTEHLLLICLQQNITFFSIKMKVSLEFQETLGTKSFQFFKSSIFLFQCVADLMISNSSKIGVMHSLWTQCSRKFQKNQYLETKGGTLHTKSLIYGIVCLHLSFLLTAMYCDFLSVWY